MAPQMQEAMALAESKHEEVSRLQASTQGLEERVAVTSSRLRQREDALQALEAEFETFRQSTAQATHDQLEEMSSIVEAQQAEIARAHMVIEGAKDWQEELRALCSHMGPHGSSSPGGPPETPGSVSQQASAANRPLLPHIAVLLGQLIRGGAGNTGASRNRQVSVLRVWWWVLTRVVCLSFPLAIPQSSWSWRKSFRSCSRSSRSSSKHGHWSYRRSKPAASRT